MGAPDSRHAAVYPLNQGMERAFFRFEMLRPGWQPGLTVNYILLIPSTLLSPEPLATYVLHAVAGQEPAVAGVNRAAW